MQLTTINSAVLGIALLSVLPLFAVADANHQRFVEEQNATAKLGSIFSQVAKIIANDGAIDDQFGQAVAIAGDTVVIGARLDNDNGNNSGSAYIFQRRQDGASTWQQVAKLLASNNAAEDRFGQSVAIADDTVVIGAPFADNQGANSGLAYIFSRHQNGSNTWGQVTELAANDGAAFDQFGVAVAIANDTVVIGANNDSDQGTFSGAAYIFQRNQGGAGAWGQVAKLTANDGVNFDDFGTAVAISGDIVVVGAHFADAQGASSGSAYVFSRNQGGANAWGQVAKLLANDGVANARFGTTVAVSGDNAVIGAPGHSNPLFNIGAAYIFSRNQGGPNAWGQVVKLLASDGATGDSFASSVSISADTALVGAPNDDDFFNDSGSAYVFNRHQNGPNAWGEVANLLADDGANLDLFSAVAVAIDQVVVGAWLDDDNGNNSGSAYIFQGSSSLNIPTTPSTTLESNQSNANLGKSIANAGDVNGDGYPDLIAGLPMFNNGAGAARLFLGTPNGIGVAFSPLQLNNQPDAQFGAAVAGIGDINNDGFDDVAVGAPFFIDGQIAEGAVFIYLGSASGLQTPAFRILQGNQENAMMGFSLAGVGDVNNDGFVDVGIGIPGFRAAVQNRQTQGLSATGAIAALLGGLANAISNTPDSIIPGSQPGAALGSSIAAAGDVNGDGVDDIIAGSPNKTNALLTNAGAAAIYLGSNTGPQAPALVEFLGTSINEALGTSVVSIGDINRDGFADVATGAPGRSNREGDEGAVHIYLGGTNPSTVPEQSLESNIANARLGSSITRIDDLNGDGVDEIMAGAPGYSDGEDREGAAFVFTSRFPGYDDEPRSILQGNQPEAAFGTSVAAFGTLNARGFTELASGAPLADEGQNDEGSVSLFAVRRVLQTSGNSTLLIDDFEN